MLVCLMSLVKGGYEGDKGEMWWVDQTEKETLKKSRLK